MESIKKTIKNERYDEISKAPLKGCKVYHKTYIKCKDYVDEGYEQW